MTNFLRVIIAAFTISLVVACAPGAASKPDPIYTSWRNNIAVGGYDVLSFYAEEPVKGDRAISADWLGSRWLFTNAENRDAFLRRPEEYAPQYGGYCAWALAQNKLAKGSPKYWSLIGGKLYLNFDKNIKTKWLADTENFIDQADKFWPEILY